MEDPLRQRKLSNIDLESFSRWYDYSQAHDAMLRQRDSKHAPWVIVPFDDKKRARLNCIAFILDRISYKKMQKLNVKPPARHTEHAYDDGTSLLAKPLM